MLFRSNGQLGIGNNTGPSTCGGLSACALTPVAVTNVVRVVAMAQSSGFACALLVTGTAKCFGTNSSGQLGTGNTTDSSTPIAVTGLANATAIAAGSYHTCALLANGTVKCWGDNFYGQLGIGNNTGPQTCGGTACSTAPVQVSGITTATAIGAAEDRTCALLANGTVKCWGRDDYVSALNTTSPVTVAGIANATAVAVAPGFTCALLANGTALCLGLNSEGELGNGDRKSTRLNSSHT